MSELCLRRRLGLCGDDVLYNDRLFDLFSRSSATH